MIPQPNADQDQVNRAGNPAPAKQNGEQPSARKPLYFNDPFTDLAFLVTLSKHAFEGSEIGECYSAAAQIQERGGVLTGYKEGLKRNRFLPGS